MKLVECSPSKGSYQVVEAGINGGRAVVTGTKLKRRAAYAFRIGVVTLLAFLCVTSCTHLRSGTAVKAGFDMDSPPDVIDINPFPEQESWASRHIPGWKSVKRLLPPPTEARRKWDERRRRESGMFDDGNSL